MKSSDALTKKTENMVNDKLADISHHFRETLKESTKELMRSSKSKSSVVPDKKNSIIDDFFGNSIVESFNKVKEKAKSEIGLQRNGSLLMSRPNAKFVPASAKHLKVSL